jgi:hypothetical protein
MIQLSYRQYLYELCTGTDFSNRDEAIRTAQLLVEEAIMYNDISLTYEAKVKELMTPKDYEEWAAKRAAELFKKQVEAMEESDFKQMILDNFEEITK